jgi:dipeptidyl aminopeptidase/acylaminoacyl peptidase
MAGLLVRIVITALVVGPVTFGPSSAQAKKFLTWEDLYRQEQVTNFAISPRGDEAVYVRTWFDEGHAGWRTALWRIDGKTGRREPLFPGEPDGRMPVYSADGKWLAYVSDKSTELNSQPIVPSYSDRSGAIYVVPRYEFKGSNAYGIGEASGFGEQAMADPFYGRITFVDSGTLCFVAGRQDFDDPPRPYRRRSQFEDQGEGYEGYHAAAVRWGGLESFSKVQYVSDEFWYGDPNWTPDGTSFVCHANLTDDQESVRYSINKNYDLWQFQRDGERRQKPRQLTTNPGPDVSPRISPDGKHVLYLSVPRKGPHMDVFNLCVLSLDGDEPKPRALVAAHDAERAADGTPPFQPTFPLRDDSWIDERHVRVRGVRGMKTETLVFNIAGPDAEISALATPEPPQHVNMHLVPPPTNAWLEDRHMAREEIVRWKSFDGLEVEGVLTLPPSELPEPSPYSLIVYPHGGPHGASKPGFNFPVHLFAAHGFAVFQPNFRGSYGYGRKFLDAARFDMGGADMQDILTGIDMLIARGTVAKDRLFVYGTSYGGYSACRLIGMTDRFRAAVAVNPVTDLHAMWSLGDLQSWTEWEFGGKPWETVEHEGRKIDVGALMRERSPTTHVHKVKTPTLILHSDHDRRCPVALGRMFHRGLKEAGCKTEIVEFKDERHVMWQVHNQSQALGRTINWFLAHDVNAPEEGKGQAPKTIHFEGQRVKN